MEKAFPGILPVSHGVSLTFCGFSTWAFCGCFLFFMGFPPGVLGFQDKNLKRDWFFQEKIASEPEPGWLELCYIMPGPQRRILTPDLAGSSVGATKK